MTTPLTAPTFGDKYNVGLTDIGAGYAQGITSAGQSIAGAIGAVMGGYNAKTGEVQEGILDQKKSSEQTLDMLHQHGMMTNEEYEKAKTSGLGAQQKMIGMYTSEFNTKLQAQLEQQKAMALAQANNQASMARTMVGEQGAMARTVVGEQGANQRATTAKGKTFVLPPPPVTTQAPPLPNKLNLGSGY